MEVKRDAKADIEPPDELSRKLREFDRNADQAVDFLRAWLTWHRDYLVSIARGRHALGHYRYGDNLLYEYNENQLEAEAAEELADAIVYITRRIAMRND